MMLLELGTSIAACPLYGMNVLHVKSDFIHVSA